MRSLAVVITVHAAAGALAGPLTPPVGPIAPTPGPEPRIAVNAANTPGDANSVFRIAQPGSYYLAGNVAGAVARHGIEIEASGVTLDLNGFEIAGVAGALDGISVPTPATANITIVNGLIRNFPGDGVDAFNAAGVRLDGVTAANNGMEGLMTGDGAIVTRCIGRSNGVSGIRVTNGCTVAECTGTGNTTRGFITGSGCTVSNCSALSNPGFGFVVANSTIVDSAAHNNGSAGIFSAGHATIARCTIRNSGADGIQAGEACVIVDCVSRANVGDGIEVFSDSRVSGNVCDDNGTGDGASIHALGTRNRIENNRCAGADRGLDIDAAGNTVANNVVVQHTDNYAIAAGNQVEVLLGQLPERIDFPCNVRLSGSLTGIAGDDGITIASNDVTIDLAGFSLVGVPGSLSAVTTGGIAPVLGLSVRNGTVRGWGGDGAQLTNASGARFENVTFAANSGSGIVPGVGATVRQCTATNNAGAGFFGLGSCTHDNCTATNNGDSGFVLASGSSAEACVSLSNGGRGFSTLIGTSVQRCTASFNGGSGIFVQTGCTIVGNSCHSNGIDGAIIGAGIETGPSGGAGSRIEGNNCTSNEVGFNLPGFGALVIRNSARGNGVNYSIAVGNSSAQIINVSGVVGFVSTDPNANLAY
jgi:hypothetical protein